MRFSLNLFLFPAQLDILMYATMIINHDGVGCPHHLMFSKKIFVVEVVELTSHRRLIMLSGLKIFLT